ncbi:MAG: hypothetical protein Q4B67_03180 [Eubacteriales bacterium]|nr:hypothetical protein [Eubacteriales bacterium]
MKKIIRIAIVSMLIASILSITAFAASTRKEYRAEVAPINQEIKALNEEMKAVRAEIKASQEQFRQIRDERKANGTFSAKAEDWLKAKELRLEAKEVGTLSNVEIKELRATAKELMQGGSFDEAVEKTQAIVPLKKAQLEKLNRRNGIWKMVVEVLTNGTTEKAAEGIDALADFEDDAVEEIIEEE